MLDLPRAGRRAFLERECPDDPALRTEVLEILEAGEGPAPLLDRPAAQVAAVVSEVTGETRVPMPDRVGPYRIERVIGEGGMGTVFLAHRDDGHFDQQVALKLVRRGPHLDSRVVRRFREERQILAALSHPDIARLLDGGIAEDGLPFFAMEYVEGEAITKYCDRRSLGIEERLSLFVRVCDALAHAHEKQIVHRDVKPSNILVTTEGHPWLLDFGIAKLLVPDDESPGTAISRRSERLLTPEYASPEQIKGEPVGIAADVYCLGVLLYELLTGQRPFRRAERTAHELERAVLEEDPTRPSEAVQREPLRRRLRGDLDAIVLTAMNKEPERRYGGAAELAADVRLHLAGRPVTARSASPVYVIRRWVRRHRVAVRSAAAGAVLTAIVVTMVARAGSSDLLVTGATRRVTLGPELELDPELSPDGKRIAYAGEAGDRIQILVRPVEGGPTVPVAEALPGSHWHPRWSPDGRMIAYVENWAIQVRPVGGGPPTVIAEQPAVHSLAWSPDGQWIAFVSGSPAFVSGESPLGSETNLGNIAPSAIWLVRPRGGRPVQVTDARSLNTCPVWLPESRALLFVSNREGNRDIYRVDLDASGRPAGEPDRLTTGLSMHSFSVSVGGDRLVYAIFAYTANIWTVDVPERGPVSAAAATPFTQGTQVIESMSLSPDGRWLAFDSDRNGNQDVYKLSVEGGVPVQLTNSPRTSSSPPGRATVGRSQGIRITAAPDGCSSSRPRAVSPVTSPVAAQSAITRLLAGRKAARLHLRCVGAASALPGVPKRERLVGRATAAHIERGVGGPVGARRARDRILPARGCVAHRPGRRPAEAIGRCRARRLAGTGARAVEPDGRTIYYKAFNAAGHSSLWSVAASGGPPRLLVRFDDPSRPSSRPEFTTDGRRFYFTVTERLSDIWSMELRRE